MSKETETTEYEPGRLPHPRWIAGSVIGFVLFTAVAMGALYLYYLPFAHERPFSVSKFSEPRLQIDPSRDLDRLDRAQNEALHRTEWREKKGGSLTIPIDAAMRAVAARGDNAYQPLSNAPRPKTGKRPPGATAPGGRRSNPGAGKPDDTGATP